MVLLNTALVLRLREHSLSIVFNYAITISQFGKRSGKLEYNGNNVLDWTESNSLDEYADSLQDWMSCLPERLRQIPVWDLTLPGSHDSGSYALESKSGIAPDKPDLRKWWMRVFGFVAYPIVKKWTITQTIDLQQQLESGIRYFDLRAAPKNDEVDLYFVHGLYGPKIVDMCREINSFLDNNSKEIVIIHVQHFVTAGAEQQLHLLLEMISIFKHKVCPFEPHHANITIEQLWQKKYQVFLFFPCKSTVRSNFLWPGNCIPNPWANTTKADYLNKFLSDQLNQRCPSKFFVTQGVLTPDDGYVKNHLFSSLYRRLVLPCNSTVDRWLDDKEAGCRGPNIVMTDFVEWNDFKIPRKTIGLNYKVL